MDPLDSDKVKVRSDARETSREAARNHSLRAGTARVKVLTALARSAMTDEELAHNLRMSPNTARPRRVELVEDGYVEATPMDATQPYRLTAMGEKAIVWRATDVGRLALRNHLPASAQGRG